MGSVLRGVGSVLKTVAPVAAIASNLLPGGSAISKILTGVGTAGNIVGGLQQQGAAQGKADQYSGQIGGIGSGLAQLGGIDPATGRFDPTYNPYSGIADTMFDPKNLIGSIVQNREGTDAQADNAVSANVADSLGRGFTSSDTALTAANNDTRTRQAIANNGFSRQLFANNLQNKNNFLAQGLAQRNQSLGQAFGTFGGLQGMYQGQANAAGAGVGQAIGGLAKSGFDLSGMTGNVGNWFADRLGVKRKQSTSLGTTNAQSPSPVVGYPGG